MREGEGDSVGALVNEGGGKYAYQIQNSFSHVSQFA